MSAGWISDEERTVVDLLHARLESDPDGPYLDVTGTPPPRPRWPMWPGGWRAR